MGYRSLVVRALQAVRARKVVSPEELAFELDKSPTYVRYSIMRSLIRISECVSYDKQTDLIRWVCDDHDDHPSSAEAAVVEAQ